MRSEVSSRFAYRWLSGCPAGARVSVELGAGLLLQVLVNPVRKVVWVLVTGAVEGSLNLVSTNGQGSSSGSAG